MFVPIPTGIEQINNNKSINWEYFNIVEFIGLQFFFDNSYLSNNFSYDDFSSSSKSLFDSLLFLLSFLMLFLFFSMTSGGGVYNDS